MECIADLISISKQTGGSTKGLTSVTEVTSKVSHSWGVQGIGECSASLANANSKLMAGAICQAVASLVQSAKGQAEPVEQATSSIVGGGLADGRRVDVRGHHNLQQSHASLKHMLGLQSAGTAADCRKAFKIRSKIVTHCFAHALYVHFAKCWIDTLVNKTGCTKSSQIQQYMSKRQMHT